MASLNTENMVRGMNRCTLTAILTWSCGVVDAKSNGEDNTIYLPEFEAVIKKINSISYFSDLEVFFAERIAFVTEMQTVSCNRQNGRRWIV